MPTTFYTEEEYKKLEQRRNSQINSLLYQLKKALNEECNMIDCGTHSCGGCKYNGWDDMYPKCTSIDKYFSK